MALTFSPDKPLRVLLVDDDEIDRLSVQRALKKAGFSPVFTEACDAETAESLSLQDRFDIIFLDFYLPDQDGLSLLKQLRNQGLMIPIIMLTGQNNEQTIVDLMQAGAADYLNKADITATRLRRRIHSALRVYQAEQATRQAKLALEASNALLRQKNHELERHRQRIEAQNRELLRAVRLKSEFVATISHELRTPMNSILGFAQVLSRKSHGALSSYQSKMVQRIETNARHLMSLIDNLLDFSTAETGQIALQSKPFNLSTLVADVVTDARQLVQQKALTLKLDDQLSNATWLGDSTRMRQILVNLLSNAIKFTPAGQITIQLSEVTDRDASPAQPMVQIQVSDSGIGIAPESQELIFDTFRQVDQGITRDQGGTGLGLAIVKSLVELMEGSITVESQLGEGACFTLRLPRAEPSRGENPAVPSAGSEQPTVRDKKPNSANPPPNGANLYPKTE
jgi:signal transduction histidine kinase